MPLDILIGAQWGDEGKGRLTDLLASQADIVARFSGGDNAGHTVTVGTRLFKLHLIPSGIVHPRVTCVLGNGMVINPATLVQEMDALSQSGIDVSPARLALSSGAHVITPAHLALDGAEEAARAAGELGTTRRGIGPAYADKAARRGLRAGSMNDPEAFGVLVKQQIERAARWLESVYHLPVPDAAQAADLYRKLAARLAPYLANTGAMIAEALQAGRTVLAEGAQGTLLDLDHGTYPFVTSSHPTAAGAFLGLGIGPRHVRRIIGVAKAFQTRVGAGPFPTEVFGETAERLRGKGDRPWDEFGTTTGRPRRVGWLDVVLLRYAVRVNGLTHLALTKLDVLTGMDSLKLCVAYRRNDHRYADLPALPSELEGFLPEYETLPGWTEEVSGGRRWESLPPAARTYVNRIAALADVPVEWISVGPERDQIVYRQAPA